ncbi:hypothetical protein [Bradyrhizobium sp.]|jgi:hypothetical protein|uniref:hypothetical protein n=2 Tax=Nitrobacteraceae TaxID=41294 RepID=UPI003918C03F
MYDAEFSWIAVHRPYSRPPHAQSSEASRTQSDAEAGFGMAGQFNTKGVSMERAIMILATAALASTLAIGAANAHGGGGHGFGGGTHLSGMGHGGGFGGGARFGGEHLGFGGLRQHAFHHYGLPGYGYYGAYPDCYNWYELHSNRPFPLNCS